jgi:hypothetical protein
MTTMTDSTSHRFRAFISYSKQDQQHAKRLHSALETYRVPKGINVELPRDRRLGRFFRDDDEMGASVDLGGTLREALDDSENLIVICSPKSARSKWVNAEIVHFKNRARRIFAVVVDGIPNSNDPELNCFPPALATQSVGEEDLLSERHAEPLGIDLRKEPFKRARIRLVAGLLGISFDSLWQREKRRTIKRRAVAAVVSLVLASVIVLLGVNWLTERRRVSAQRVDRTLVKVRDDLASERVDSALRELASLAAEGEKGAVENVLLTTLGWVSTPEELLKQIKPPVFVTDGSKSFIVAADGTRHPLDMNRPYRRILTSDQRQVLLINEDETAVLNVADGRELARIVTNGIQWQGRVFETGNGLMMVAGRFAGLTNGTIRCAFLVYSQKEHKLSMFDLVHLAPFRALAVSPDCRTFGIQPDKDQGLETEINLEETLSFVSAETSGLKEATAPDSVADWKIALLYADASGAINFMDTADGAGDFERLGCVAPGSDSASPGAQSGPTGLFHPIGLGAFWEPEANWKVVRENVELPVPGFGPVSDDSPCTEERPCSVQNPNPDYPDDGSFGGWASTLISRPRGVPKDDRSFDSVNNDPVFVGYTQNNAGFDAAWCRKVKGKLVCFVSRDQFELQNEETFDLRSSTGRFIYNPRGLTAGFQLYDLASMRDVTPKGPQMVADTGQVEFSPNDEQLFVALNGRLRVFTPPGDGGNWQLVKDPALPVPGLSGNKDDKVAGLIAVDDKDLVAVTSSGVITRFDWRTGRQSWTRSISSVGKIDRVVVSRNRRFLFVIGKDGGRLFDTSEGLVVSGTLVPPNAMAGRVEMDECFTQAFVSDNGVLQLICGDKQYRREPITFSGDARSRLREILASQ